MIAPSLSPNEYERQKAVDKYRMLDKTPNSSFDAYTSLLSYICNTPIALITLLDNEHNFLKSHHGINFDLAPRETSFCGHAILSEAPIMIIEDARTDARFYDNPLVTEQNIVFYAGVPLIDKEGYKLGTLCVFDYKPRVLDEHQIRAIQTMAAQVMQLFEQKLKNKQLQKFQEQLKLRNQNLEKFARVVSHDLKSPLANITSLTELLEVDNGDILSEDSLLYIKYLKASSSALREYIDGLLAFYKSDNILKHKKEIVLVNVFFDRIAELSGLSEEVTFSLPNVYSEILINKPAMQQVFLNLVTNSYKYNTKREVKINIDFEVEEDYYKFILEDNGNGISPEDQEKIFELFTTLNTNDRQGNSGSGIGLATVKKIITNLEGTIRIESKVDTGSRFIILIPAE
ncbi:ATP-binding protein [Aquimarina sp. W85]|uniref:sensor histidine kinase n=1 Tax=Aquimarina rhodophyticola TaxID=3342246 RepID=UPI003670454A